VKDFVKQFREYDLDPKKLAIKPNVILCSSWGAAKAREDSPKIKPTEFVIHHMATQNRPNFSGIESAISAGEKLAKDCQKMHMTPGKNNPLTPDGASDTGQHLTLTIDGILLEGRHGSGYALLNGWDCPKGAQCYGHNDNTFGMEHEGNFMDCIPNISQMEVSLTVAAWFTMTRSLDSHSAFHGHRERVATGCPGDAFEILIWNSDKTSGVYLNKVHDVIVEMKKIWSKDDRGNWVKK
jgi:hypothetical protein